MPTVVTKTVRAPGDGGDYTSLSAWDAGEAKNLVAADEIGRALCSNFKDTTFASIQFSWTTDLTRFVEIVAEDDHESTGGISTKAYRLVRSGTGMEVTHINARLVGIQVRSGKGILIGTLITGGIITCEKCLFIGSGGVAGVHITNFNGGRTRLINCQIEKNNGVGTARALEQSNSNSTTLEMYNCTLNGHADTPSNVTAIYKNCYALSYVGGGSPTLIRCASADNTGTSGLQNITKDFDTFVDPSGVSFGAEGFHPNDFRLAQNSPLRGSGLDTSGESAPFDFTDDYRGRSRLRGIEKGWDIGCYKFVAPSVFIFI